MFDFHRNFAWDVSRWVPGVGDGCIKAENAHIMCIFILNKGINSVCFYGFQGPDYELQLEAGNRADLNDEDHLNHVLETVKNNMQHVKNLAE